MPLETCSFCKREIPTGSGVLYIKKDGSMLRFCSRKCRKNMLILRRNPTKVKWVRVLEHKRIKERRLKKEEEQKKPTKKKK